MAEQLQNYFESMGQPGYQTAMGNRGGTAGNAYRKESIASAVFTDYLDPRKPLRTWMNLQQGSMMMNYMSGTAWNNLAAGRGMQWSGIVGLRSAAAGQQAFSRRMINFSPPQKIIGMFVSSAEKLLGKPGLAAAYQQSGLFAPGGVLNREGTARV